MGFLDRVIGGTNAVYEKWTDLTTVTDPTLGAASRRMAQGDAAVGTITGIRRQLNDQTEDLLAVSATDSTGAVHRFGIQVALGSVAMSRLRLGLQVPLRVDGKKAVLDGPALGAAFGVDLSNPTQRSKRSVPDDGIHDSARDSRVLKRLDRWPRASATVTGFEPIFVMGMRTVSWDVHVQVAGAGTGTAPSDEVPFYVQSFVAPGTEVSVAVDPEGGATVAVDWPALALATPLPGDPTAPPQPGSLAEQIAVAKAADAEAMAAASTAARPTPTAPPPGVITNHALRTWVDGVKGGYMKPKELEQGARDLVAVGMVTQEEADTALREAGLR